MKRRYILSPEAGFDLVKIWRHIGSKADPETAERVESVIRETIVYLAGILEEAIGAWT